MINICVTSVLKFHLNSSSVYLNIKCHIDYISYFYLKFIAERPERSDNKRKRKPILVNWQWLNCKLFCFNFLIVTFVFIIVNQFTPSSWQQIKRMHKNYWEMNIIILIIPSCCFYFPLNHFDWLLMVIIPRFPIRIDFLLSTVFLGEWVLTNLSI